VRDGDNAAAAAAEVENLDEKWEEQFNGHTDTRPFGELLFCILYV
jgi:hypothetical protein